MMFFEYTKKKYTTMSQEHTYFIKITTRVIIKVM